MVLQQDAMAFAESILSKDVAIRLSEGFTNVLRSASKKKGEGATVLIPVITRRCFVLFFAYYETLCAYWHSSCFEERPEFLRSYGRDDLANLKATFESCVITDNAAWAMAYDMVADYRRTGAFPSLFVVDELLFHGRALNGFLYGLEKRLADAESLYERAPNVPDGVGKSAVKAFLGQLHIFVINYNVGASVLLPRYQKVLDRDSPEAALPIKAWRARSIAYAQYVSVCGINNVGFAMGLAISAHEDTVSFSEVKPGFTKISTELQGLGQDTWLYFYPSVSQPRIVCTIRRKQSQIGGEKNLYVPYIIVDHASFARLLELHCILLREAQQSGKQRVTTFLAQLDEVLSAQTENERVSLVPWLAQTTDLVLTSWLIKRFLREQNITQAQIDGEWKESIGWRQLVASFRSYGKIGQDADNVREMLEELWGWEPTQSLEDYLAVYAADAKPFSVDWMDLAPIQRNARLGEGSPLVQCVEDTISRIAFEAEQNAYVLYGSGLFFTDADLANWGDDHSVDTLLAKLRAEAQVCGFMPEPVNIYEVMAVIVQAMDLGLLGMNVAFERQPCANLEQYWTQPHEVYTRQRAGEAALFLLPVRYRNLLTVFGEIREKRKRDMDGAAFDLERLARKLSCEESGDTVEIAAGLAVPAAHLARRLYRAYELFIRGGQNFNEWRCDLRDRRLSAQDQEVVSDADRRLQVRFLQAYRDL